MDQFIIFEFKYFLLILIGAVLFLYKKSRPKNPGLIELAKTLPGPTPLPWLGNVSNGMEILASKNPLAVVKKMNEKYGYIYRLQVKDQIMLIVGGVNNLQITCNSPEILGRQFHKTFVKFGGDGLFSSAVSVWKTDRKILQPPFAKNALKSNIPKMNHAVQQFVQKLRKFQNGGEFDIRDHCSHFVSNFFSQTQFDYELDDHEAALLDIRADSRKIITLIAVQEIIPVLKSEYPYNLIYRLFLQPIQDKYSRVMKKMLCHKMKQLQELHNEDQDTDSTMFLSDLKDGLKNEKWMIDQLRSFTGAGTDTVTETLSFCLLMIAMHPEIQMKLHNELFAVFGNDPRLPTADDLERLEYLNQVIKETQRRWTLTPFVVRVAEKDFNLGSHSIPAGTNVLLDLVSVHFDPEFYPNPFEFNPDNFSPEASAKRPKYSFIPFCAGPRMCIGKEYTEFELKLGLTALLRAYSFHTTMKMEMMKVKFLLIIYSPTGYPVSIRPR